MADNKDDEEIYKSYMDTYKDEYNVINEDNFILPSPDMGDYELDDVSDDFLKALDKANGGSGDSGEAAAFYTQNPETLDLGYHDDLKLFCIKATPDVSNSAIENGDIDGDTVYFKYNTIEDGGGSFTILGIKYNGFKDYVLRNLPFANLRIDDVNYLSFGLRFLGYDAPEVPHYKTVVVSEDYFNSNTITIPSSKISSLDPSEWTYLKSSNSSQRNFIKISSSDGTQYYEYVSCEKKTYDNNVIGYELKTVIIDNSKNDAEYIKQAHEMAEDMASKIQSATDMRIIIDANTVNKLYQEYVKRPTLDEEILQAITNPKAFFIKMLTLNQTYKIYRYFNAAGQDLYRRFIGEIYIKDSNGIWMNLGKYMVSKYNQAVTNPVWIPDAFYRQNYNFVSDAFKSWTYDYKNKIYVDSVEQMAKNTDDRREVQKQLIGQDLDDLRQFTVMIGDCLFILPPTSIRCISQTQTERVPLIRSKGTIDKSAPKAEKSIELTMYFNGDAGINGMPYETELPAADSQTGKKQKITYYMNGLRTLIAEFKFTPFLPIENEYVNDVLDIEAVTLVNLQITTMPGYPGCLAATLTLQDFNYCAYMPECANLFKDTIDYSLMRWYYQRTIQKGNYIKNMFSFDSKEYMEQVFGKTCLQPIEIGDSSVNFYLPDKNFLNEKLQLKLNSISSPIQVTEPLSDTGREFIKQLGYIYQAIYELVNGGAFNDKLDEINKDIKSHLQDFLKLNRDPTYASMLYDIVYNGLVGLNKAPLVKDIQTKTSESTDSGITTRNIDFVLDLMNIFSNDTDRSNTFKAIGIDAGADKEGIVNNNCVLIRLTYKVKIEKGQLTDIMIYDSDNISAKLVSSMAYNTDTLSYKILKKCAISVDLLKPDGSFNDTAGTTDMQNEQNALKQLKEETDLEDAASIKYVKYDIGNCIIRNVSCVMSNAFTRMSLKSFDGESPQYIGGQDSIIEITIDTTDKNTVELLNNIPQLSAQYARDYRIVLSTWPLRIDSQLTRLFGINEILVESVDSTTIKMQPGVYTVVLRACSVDRSVRNKEALKKLDIKSNAGPKVLTREGSYQTKSYFNLKDILAEAEVYPDLELPTLDELSEVGYNFIKYTAVKSNRKYPDPDFYFVYSYPLMNAIIKNSVTDTLNNGITYDSLSTTMSDRFGASATIKSEPQKAYVVLNKNQMAQKETDASEKVQKEIDKVNNNIYKKHYGNKYTPQELMNGLKALEAFDGWRISDKVICLFREKRYITEDIKNASVGDELSKLSDKIIGEIDSILSKPIEASESMFGDTEDVKAAIDAAESQFFAGVGSKIYTDLFADNNIQEQMEEIIYAAAAAKSGQCEYNEAVKNNWKPKAFANNKIPKGEKYKTPTCIITKDGQLGGRYQAATFSEAIKDGTQFGIFGIKQYSKNDIERITGTTVDTKEERLFLDPYYMNIQVQCSNASTEDEQNGLNNKIYDYKKGILIDPYYATKAFIRNILFWVKIMLKDKILISAYSRMQDEMIKQMKTSLKSIANEQEVETNVGVKIANGIDKLLDSILGKSSDSSTTVKDKNIEQQRKQQEQEVKDTLEACLKTMKSTKDAIMCGIFFAPCAMTVLDGDNSFYSLMKDQNYNTLNELTESVMSSETKFFNDLSSTMYFRKFILALCGAGLVKSIAKIETDTTLVSDELDNAEGEKIYIKAADDPQQFIMHSFYDMVVNDKRGRMLRAFPTFYLMFIDEGREIGIWKLHDNFYNVNAISELQVVKSRKIAADTARITLTNLFRTFTTPDEDIKTNNTYDVVDALDSIFSPRKYFLQEESRRLNMANIERVNLQAGTRISLRMGYGADASTLPIIFNGSVAEVEEGELLTLVAQGDGVEISNVLLESSDLEDVQYNDNLPVIRTFKKWFTRGATPRTILSTFLASKGTFLGKEINKITNGRFFSDNPFGIVHFGDPMFKDIFKWGGECVQNIYEAITTPSWGNNYAFAKNYSTERPPKFSSQTCGKSYWDIMQLCRSASLDFISAVVPFGVRSSIFYGAPRYYYAYDYDKDSKTGRIREKRKPFQQYHIYSSYSDIISDGITASSKDIRTCAIGIYTGQKVGKNGAVKTDKMWIDYDIYPENQKTMIVNTQLISKGIPILGWIPFVNVVAEKANLAFQTNELAWRMTADALKQTVKDMYTGELIIIGDPSVKPNDRIWIDDIYERINGCCMVESVTHSFSTENGFITSITPDCIAAIDDRYEPVVQTFGGSVFTKAAVAYSSAILGYLIFKKTSTPLLNVLGRLVSKGAEGVGKLSDGILSIIGKDGLEDAKGYKKYKDILSKIPERMTGTSNISVFLENLKDIAGDMGNFTEPKSLSDAAKIFNRIGSAIKSGDPSSSISQLQEALEVATSDGDTAKVEKISKAIEKLKDYSSSIVETVNDSGIGTDVLEGLKGQLNDIINAKGTSEGTIKAAQTAVDNLSKLIDGAKDGAVAVDDIEGAGNAINSINNALKIASSTESSAEVSEGIAEAAKGVFDSVKGGFETADTVANDAEIAGGIAATVGTASLLTTLGAMVIEYLAFFIIAKTVDEAITRKVKSLQVLQIFPLKKEGRVYTAGLDGTRGMVYGSPTYDDPGLIEGFLTKVFRTDRKGFWGTLANIVVELFTSDNFRDAVNRYKRQNGLPESGTVSEEEVDLNSILSTIGSDEVKRMDAYRAVLITPRITSTDAKNDKDAYASFDNYSIQNTSDIRNNSEITQNMTYIPDSKIVKNLTGNGELILQHNQLQDMKSVQTDSYKSTTIQMSVSGEQKNVPVIWEKSNGREIYDIPFLRGDAMAVLTEILNRINDDVNSSSTLYNSEQEKTNMIVIKSALRVGDSSWRSTGFSFRIAAPSYGKIGTLLENIRTDFNSSAATMNPELKNPIVFKYSQVSGKNNTYDVLVYPPKVNILGV